jgi:hypothetical protein
VRRGLAVALAGTVCLWAGCENNADTDLGQDLPPRENFYITPSSVELRPAVGNQAVFTVVGGEAPFTWTVERAPLGTITPTGERSAVYQRTPAVRGVNTVTVRDATVLKAGASVIQE